VFEQLSGSITWQVTELQSGVKIATNEGAQSTNISYTCSIHVSIWIYIQY